MPERVVPMIHVPDVRAASEWYEAIGFTIVRTHDEDGHMDWALLAFGSTEVMLNEGGRPSPNHRREVDLYVHTDRLDELHARLSGIAEIVEDIHDTFYGMREFIIRDLNRFWITFGQPLQGG
jgi:catechol 2,3-dioxygenase-like lactoylglutathione lyase family enzyme